MAIAASSVLPVNSLEDFRIEFNNLISDVNGITATNKFDASIIFEGSTADAYETTLTVTDPTADRTLTLPNATGTLIVTSAVSGDATMSTAGAVTIAATSVEGSMLNNNVISGQTALTSGLATTDELLLSDGGTLKRVDVSIVTDLAAGDATALAIALG